MLTLVSIDPGSPNPWCALWEGEGAILTGIRCSLWRGDMEAACVVIERPQIYQQQVGRPSDVENLLLQVGWLQREWCDHAPVDLVYPRTWKGQEKKPTCHRRIWFDCLDDVERKVISDYVGRDDIGEYIEKACQRLARTGKVSGYSRKDHNILDAVGIGWWWLHQRGLR